MYESYVIYSYADSEGTEHLVNCASLSYISSMNVRLHLNEYMKWNR